MNTFIQQGCIKLIKSVRKAIYNILHSQRFLFQLNAVNLLTLL